MPVNHFINRPEDACYPSRLAIGDTVMIIQKGDQGTRDLKKLVTGRIIHIYSHGEYYDNGAKVQILLDESDHRYPENPGGSYIGRVQYILKKVDLD